MEQSLSLRRLAQRKGIKFDVGQLVLLVPACLISLAILSLLFTIFWMSLRTGLPGDATPFTLQNYESALTDPFTYRVILNTIVFAAATMFTVMFFAIPMVLLMERTDLPLKTVFAVFMNMTILIPAFLTAMGWILLLSPRNGVVNVWLMGLLGLENAPLSVYNLPMMGYVQGMSLMPVAYFMVAAAFRSMDPSLEEASRTSGASGLQTLLRVTLPATLPAILAAFIYVAMITFAVFEVPGIVGAPLRIFVFSTAIYRATSPEQGLPQYGLAGAYGFITVLIGLLLSYFYARTMRASHKYAVVTGKGYRPKLAELGRWKWAALAFMAFYFIPAVVMPFFTLVWASVLPYLQVPSLQALATASLARYSQIGDFLTLRPIINTVLLVLLAPSLIMLFSCIISWLVTRSQVRGRRLLDTIAFLPHTTPSILFAVSLAYLALVFREYVPIYGTMAIILVAHVVTYISFGTRTMNSSLIQLQKELEEAAQMAGASLLNILGRIIIPLVRHAIVNGWIWVALLSFREVTMGITLMTSDANTVVTTQIWRYWSAGRIPEASVLGVLIFFMMTAFVILARSLGRRITGS